MTAIIFNLIFKLCLWTWYNTQSRKIWLHFKWQTEKVAVGWVLWSVCRTDFWPSDIHVADMSRPTGTTFQQILWSSFEGPKKTFTICSKSKAQTEQQQRGQYLHNSQVNFVLEGKVRTKIKWLDKLRDGYKVHVKLLYFHNSSQPMLFKSYNRLNDNFNKWYN
jgi:hypothetical protein